ncbi:MAG: hypothetical protein BWX80_03697 [Candidatus Hydrogenedentes bacterium ADurb.Bin101]|nr:MAG: hypothetical protein BWX80_03697 [Candidatus Hydrogenedentes bacterium ADurb.Bin101]
MRDIRRLQFHLLYGFLKKVTGDYIDHAEKAKQQDGAQYDDPEKE